MSDIDTNALKAAAPIIPYIETHYKNKIIIEKRSKGTVFSRCLWHDENTPSLAFFSNGTYKCFGCGEHGDIITLVQFMEHVSFEEACKIIGDNVGFEVILEPPNPIHENYKNQMDNHTRRYWNNLQNNPEALSYIMNDRGISSEMIDLYRLGFTDPEEYKYRNLGGISSRIVFPILEHKRRNPKCVGMAYRCLNDDKPKYINDQNQDGREGQDKNLEGIFIKSNMLYGLHQAYEGIAKFGYIIVTEGYFDVIALYQSGLTNAVCTMGTSLSENQISIISKLTNNVLLMYDSDSAGISSMFRCMNNLFKEGFHVAVCVLDPGKDPADTCKAAKFNYFAVNSFISQHTEQGTEFVIDRCVKRYENIAAKERTKALNMLNPIMDSMPDGIQKEAFKNRIFKRLDIK